MEPVDATFGGMFSILGGKVVCSGHVFGQNCTFVFCMIHLLKSDSTIYPYLCTAFVSILRENWVLQALEIQLKEWLNHSSIYWLCDKSDSLLILSATVAITCIIIITKYFLQVLEIKFMEWLNPFSIFNL